MSVHPAVTWAQRSSESEPAKNIVYLTIEVQDPVDVKLDLTATKLTFSAQSADKATQYALDLEFFDEIDPEQSRTHEAGNKISLVLRKKKAQAEFWPRLLKEKVKLHYIKTDFDKWVDEDEQEEVADENDDMANMMGGMGGMPGMGGMGGMPGMGGMGGMPGMGGMGGMPGMGGAGGPDLSQLLGGAGGDFDFSKLASQLGKGGEMPDFGDEEGEEGEEGDEGDVEAEISTKN
ncbi:hypothetical protein PUMCH_003587 [Australozyma saopauloensis]|uniref:CS domain-containing protein n=1 Tax=Australozyma saopauloensis TaxID=291208 RepID=A0AAX4HCE9_9ASCO|nr:hypothetical protein PUMCH_003587 [[Candida] saopauloensis]